MLNQSRSSWSDIYIYVLLGAILVTSIILIVVLGKNTQSTPTPQPICPNISSFSGEVVLDSVLNLLPCSGINSNCSQIWNAAANGEGGTGTLPDWVVFDFGQMVTMSLFKFSTLGDTGHDITSSLLQVGSTKNGAWLTVNTIISCAGTDVFQLTIVDNITSRYFRWFITATESGYQSYVRCVEFTAYAA